MKARLVTALAGLALGFSLSRIGFASWDEVHRMFVFDDTRLLFTFFGAALLLVPGWSLMRVAGVSEWITRSIHKGTLVGGLLFGVGWAICGACPGIVFVQLGEGQMGALWTLGGLVAGNFLYAVVHARWFKWSTGSCIDG